MRLVLTRSPSVNNATVGTLYIDGGLACHTLEDQIREIPGVPVADWKIPHVTAIPAGEYIVFLENSGKFGPDTLTLKDVPGFTYIRMHAGNSSTDTDGCILLGMRATEWSLVGGTSRPAVEMVKAEVRAAIDRGEVVHIEVRNPTEYA